MPANLPMWKGAVFLALLVSLAFPLTGLTLLAFDLAGLTNLPAQKRRLS